MHASDELITERLLLRRWRPADREPFAAMNADARVMELLRSALTRAQSDQYIEAIEHHFAEHGFGLWALELRADGRLVGMAGLNTVAFDAHFTPAVEVGWRLERSAWGYGYATEAGRAALRFGFEQARLEQVVSMTSERNARSQAVMQRIGMRRDSLDDFAHPLALSATLRPHVLYRLQAHEWAALDQDEGERDSLVRDGDGDGG
jgi:RimJ/RimL family protein N-acetyltransferase